MEIVCAVGVLALLLLFPEAAKSAVVSGLHTCGGIIIPSLFPFFVAVKLLTELGAIQRLCKKGGIRRALFLIGSTGGYPVGAGFLAQAKQRGEVDADTASRLLVWCNNSGPAFLIGAVGIGVFHSVFVGVLLYLSHLAASLLYGRLFCRGVNAAYSGDVQCKSFADALVSAVKGSVSAILNVCGFVLTFSILLSLVNIRGIAGALSGLFGTGLSFNSAFLAGFLELGNAVSFMQGLDVSPVNMALSAFVCGFGGLSVYFQTLAMISDTDIKAARYLIGRLVIALFGAGIAYGLGIQVLSFRF